MSIEFRPAKQSEMPQVGLLAAYVYAGAFGDEADNITATSIRPEWTLCAFDGAKLVASFAAFPFTMRANGKPIAMAGVTAVGTLPEYRRRGIVRKIVTQSLADQREQGQVVAGLWASQAAIYQRYGYSRFGVRRHYAIDSRDVRFADGDEGGCRVERVAAPEGIDHAKAVYREFIAARMGHLHRSSILWQENVFGGGDDGPVHAAIAFRGDDAVGYVAYTLRHDKVANVARNQEIKIRDFGWLDADAYRSIWSFLAAHDLVGRISWQTAPMDDPALDIMMEPRLLHAEDREGSWLRIIDVPGALGGRGYDADGSLVIAVDEDSLTPWNDGAWRIETSGGEYEVSRCSDPADITLPIGSLSALFSGMHSARSLKNWGLLQGDDKDVAQAQKLFATRHAPHNPDHY